MAQTLGLTSRIIQPMAVSMPIPGTNTVAPGAPGFLYADLTAASPAALNGAGDFGSGMQNFEAYVNLKTFTAGTVPSTFMIECADDAGFTVNLRRVGHMNVPIVAGPWAFAIEGRAPDGSKRYARIGVSFGAGASGTFDGYLCACP